MADFTSSLPVTMYGQSGAFFGTVTQSGTYFGAISGNVVNTGSVAITSQAVWTGVGSVTILQGYLGTVSGNVAVSSLPQWTGVGSVIILQQYLGTISGNVVNTGSVAVTNTIATSQGTRANIVQDYATSAAVAAGASGQNWYTSNGSFYCLKVIASASGRMKTTIGTGSPTQSVNSVAFNSTAQPTVTVDFLPDGFAVGSNTSMSVNIINQESVSQDVYSTTIGYYA